MLAIKEGMGESELIEAMARSLLCVHGTRLCGFCHSCQLMDSQTHPDYHLICPEKSGKPITVEQIRRVNQWSHESSQFGGYRVIVIQPADAMNESAANALLKTLEEPPEKCCFILVTEHVEQLLPTVSSRCRQIHISEMNDQDVVNWLSRQTSQTVPPYVVKLNNYAPIRALEFVQQQETENFLQLVQNFGLFIQAPVHHVHELTQFILVAPMARLTWLWHLLSDAQKVYFGITQNILQLPGSDHVAEHVSYVILYQQFCALTQLLEQLTRFSGLNSELLIFDWLLKFHEVPCSSMPTAI
jgi:DNA polymerase-3 subunit delta'